MALSILCFFLAGGPDALPPPPDGPPPREVIERLLAVHGARGVRFSPPRG